MAAQAQVAAAPPKAAAAPKQAASGRSAKQAAASRKWAAAGRRAQKGKPKTAKQLAASRHNLVRARAVQSARRAVSKKQATAPGPEAAVISLHQMPVCAAVAVAGSLQAAVPDIAFSDASILALSRSTGPVSIGELLEHVRHAGLLGYQLARFWPCDPDLILPGLVCCYQEASGYHAVLAVSGGMLSWGSVRAWPRQPEEAWYLEWELP